MKPGQQGRILIIGGPKSGKTSLSLVLASKLGIPPELVRHSDELCGVLPWGEDSVEVAKWIAEPGPYVIEGVATVRGLRKAIVAAPTVKPCDHVLYLIHPWRVLSPGQRSMTAGHWSIWSSIVEQVRALGVDVAIGPAPALPGRALATEE